MRPCILYKTFDCGQNLIRNYYHFRKYTVRQVKEGTDKLTLVENSLCRIKLTENPLYSIRWGSTLPTIPEEDPDEYNVAITGYLTFHKPLRTTPVSDAPTGLKGGGGCQSLKTCDCWDQEVLWELMSICVFYTASWRKPNIDSNSRWNT